MKVSLAVADAGRALADIERATYQVLGIPSGRDFTDQRINRVFLETLEL